MKKYAPYDNAERVDIFNNHMSEAAFSQHFFQHLGTKQEDLKTNYRNPANQ